MLVCVEAGMGLDAALGKVTDEIRIKSEALAEELHWTNLEMRAGSTREKSLRNLAARTGVDEIHTFTAMLTQADRFGTSIGESLRVSRMIYATNGRCAPKSSLPRSPPRCCCRW
jgi:tight adherence protein C